MKKVLILLLCLLCGCQYNRIKIYNNDNLIMEYNGYKITTDFNMNDYYIDEKENLYILKGISKENTCIEIEIEKDFDGYIKVKETIRKDEYQYSYCLEKRNDCFCKLAIDGKNVMVSYNTDSIGDYCYFKGFVDIKYEENKDYSCLDNLFYIIENGNRRCDINERKYMSIKKSKL